MARTGKSGAGKFPHPSTIQVFVGGLPVDVDEDELLTTFSPFGHLCIDWPNKQMNGMVIFDL